MIEWSFINSVGLLLVGAALSFFAAWYWFHRSTNARAAEAAALENKALLARVAELERLNALVTQAVLPISAAFQAILIKELTHFHTPIMDALMVKLGPPLILTETEEQELVAALKKREHDMGDQISDAERDAARMLPMVMKRVKAEIDADMTTTLQVVAVPDEKPAKE